MLDERHMAWKYWRARHDWAGSRGFAVRQEGVIVAHAAVWPVRVLVPDQVVTAAHVIDWAADPQVPGVGVWLLRQLAARVRLIIETSGSQITRRILPVIGYRPHGQVDWFARPVRPLKRALSCPEGTWKGPARLLRNTFWRLIPPLSIPSGWSAASLRPEQVPDELWPRPSFALAVTARDTGVYRYLVDAPSVRHALFGLEKDRRLVGYFCLAVAGHVARIADLWLPSGTVRDWCNGFRTAAVLASRDPDVYEVTACASTVLGKDALARAGFRLRDRFTVSVLGDFAALDGRELQVQMVDSDASFLSGNAVSYLT